jgi:glycopeptide antibiotics resistance protein
MHDPFQELPTLPIVAPPAILAFAVLLWHLRRRSALTALRALVAAAVCVYGAGVIANTVFPIYRSMPDSGQPWWDHVHLTPLAGTEAFDMVQNVLVFLPLGVLLPLVARVRSVPAALLGGFALSLLMELLQLLNTATGHGGHIADVNDLLANTVGCVAGYALFRLALLLAPARHLVAAATWPARDEEPAERRTTLTA